MSDIEKVKKLREATGAGFKDCNLAIKESKGDLDKAVEILRVKGISKASKKMSRTANEGVVALQNSGNKTSIIEVNCETDFVAKNDSFIKLANDLAEIALNHDSIENILNSKIQGINISDKLIEQTGVIGEKIEIGSFQKIKGEYVGSYIHAGNKLASLVSLSKKTPDSPEISKNISMQVAAMNPVALDENGVSQEIIEKEIEIAKDQLRQEGKPEEMLDNIAKGKLKKFFKENTLVNQQFIKDNKQSISDYLKSKSENASVTGFARIGLV